MGNFKCSVWWVLTNMYTSLTATQNQLYTIFLSFHKVPSSPFPINILSQQRSNHCLLLITYRLVEPVLELHVNGMIQYLPFLGSGFLCVTWSFYKMQSCCCTYASVIWPTWQWMNIPFFYLFIILLTANWVADGQLGCISRSI